jgi:hypothetical protein
MEDRPPGKQLDQDPAERVACYRSSVYRDLVYTDAPA